MRYAFHNCELCARFVRTPCPISVALTYHARPLKMDSVQFTAVNFEGGEKTFAVSCYQKAPFTSVRAPHLEPQVARTSSHQCCQKRVISVLTFSQTSIIYLGQTDKVHAFLFSQLSTRSSRQNKLLDSVWSKLNGGLQPQLPPTLRA